MPLSLTPLNLPVLDLIGPVELGDIPVWDGAGYDFLHYVADIRSFGAVGDASTDCYDAIMEAYESIPSAGGVLYIPAGTFRFDTALSFADAKPVAIVGAGIGSSVLAPGMSAGDAITVTGDGNTRFTASQLSINPIATRNAGTYNLKVKDCTRVIVDAVAADGTGGLFMFESCVFLGMSNCQGDSTDGSTVSDVCLRIKACTGHVSNCYFRTGSGLTGYSGSKPCLWVTGQTTSLGFSNCSFAGAGPHSKYTVSGVTSDAAKFTVTTSATHDFRVGDFVVLRGMTSATYNNMWRVGTVPTATTFTVTSTANPGASTVNGTAESVAAAALVTNEDGACSEGRFSSCLFEATQAGLYGSAALYIDGRRSSLTAGLPCQGWNLTGNYYDQYAVGLLLSGMKANASDEPTVHGISETGGIYNARVRGIHLDQVTGVAIGGAVACVPGSVTPVADGISATAGLYLYAGAAAPFTQGINVHNSFFGMGRNFQTINNTPYAFGALLDSPGLNDLLIVGNQFFGSTAGIGDVNSAYVHTQRWKIRDNIVAGGTLPPTTATTVPSVASGNTLDLTYVFADVVKITGTTNIQIINHYWVGRELQFVFTGALSLITGGNLAIGANYAVLAGQMVTLLYDATSTAWYIK